MIRKHGISFFDGKWKRNSSGGETLFKGPSPAGSELEKAYRELLLENQVLVESNHRLHDRLARAEQKLPDGAGANQLIREQKQALVTRSRQLREAEYKIQDMQRRYNKLQDQTRRLAEMLTHRSSEVAPLKKQLAESERKTGELRLQLEKANAEISILSDRYFQLQSRIDPALSADRVINADF